MAYSLSGLTAYTEQDANKLIYKIVAGDDMSQYMNVQTGIKSAETINIVATEGVWQAATNCNPTASGDTTFSQRTITIGKTAIVLEWCEEQLEAYYTQKAMKAGSTYDMLTFRNAIVDDVIQNIHRRKSIAIWQGDTTAGSAYLNKFDGLSKIIAAASGVQTATPVVFSVTTSRDAVANCLAAITDNMYAANKNGSLKMFMGTSEVRTYRQELMNDNLFHYTGADKKLYAENSDIEIVPVIGLSGTKKIYVIDTNNMYLGCDLESEEDKLSMKVLENEKIRLTIKFKYGVQIAFPDQIVSQINT